MEQVSEILIHIDEDTVYLQRTRIQSGTEPPLTRQEEVIILLYNKLQEANDEIYGLYEQLAGENL